MISTTQPEAARTKSKPSKITADVAAIANVINENWRKSVASILMVAQECAKAKASLNESEKKQLYRLLPFKEPMFSKLATIGENPRLLDHQPKLPVSISTIYEVGKLPADRFNEAVKAGVLSPDVRRQDIKAWLKGKMPAQPKTPMKLPWGLYILYSDSPLADEQHNALRNSIVELADQQGLKADTFTGENVLSEIKRHWTKKPKLD
ncbi:hypothetical protein [Bradyrhizobium elkanii]|uniref:hypothetical protein n=1 Tax=Bradyrhizobium elkanii TaxID=29448 RepID=UPI003D245A31